MNICVIPARLDSSRLPGKNQQLIGPHRLWEWTMKTASAANRFDWIIVNTDDPDIMQCEGLPQNVIVQERPADTPSDWQVAELVAQTAKIFVEDGIPVEVGSTEMIGSTELLDGTVAIMLPTSPFTGYKNVMNAVDAFAEFQDSHPQKAGKSGSEFPVMHMVNRFHHPPQRALWRVDIADGPEGKNINLMAHDRRAKDMSKAEQSYDPAFWVTGGLHIIQTRFLINNRHYFPDHIIPFEVEDEYAIDINTQADLDRARDHYRRKSEAGLHPWF